MVLVYLQSRTNSGIPEAYGFALSRPGSEWHLAYAKGQGGRLYTQVLDLTLGGITFLYVR